MSWKILYLLYIELKLTSPISLYWSLLYLLESLKYPFPHDSSTETEANSNVFTKSLLQDEHGQNNPAENLISWFPKPSAFFSSVYIQVLGHPLRTKDKKYFPRSFKSNPKALDLILKIFWLSCSGVGPRSEAMILTCKCSERLEYSCWCCSVIQSCPTLCDPMECSTPGFPVLLRLPELGQIHAPWFIDAIQHLILYRPLLMPSIFPSIRIFSKKSVIHIKLPNYWIFSFSLGSSSEYSGLISFRIDWLDILAVQGTLKSLLQHHSSKALILWHSAFFMVQLSHPYMTTGKTIALTVWILVVK